MISIIFYLFGCVVGPRMWSALMNVLHDLEKNVYSAVIGWSIL